MIEEYRPLLKNTKFVNLWASQILSQFTIHIMNFLLITRLFEITGSTIATSFLWIAYALPAVIIGPFAAASVDIFDKRKLLMITNLAQSGAILTYALIHEVRFFLIYGVAFTYAFLNQFYVPAELASLPALTPKKELAHANSLFFITQPIAIVAGFGTGGLLLSILGFTKALFLCSGLLFFAFLSVSFLPEIRAAAALPKRFEKRFIKFFQRIIEGYQFIKENHAILAPLLILIGFQIALTVIIVNVPIIAADIMKIDIKQGGLLVVVPAGIGAGAGALLTPRLLLSGWRKKRAIETFLMMLSLLLFAFAFVVPQLGASIRVPMGIFAIFLAGLCFVGVIIPAQTYIQEVTPGGLRGRVFGNYWFLVTIATIFPVIFSATITELFGIKFLLLILAGVALIAYSSSKRYAQNVIEGGQLFTKEENV